ncbi:MAG: CHC2 zinc finger domain-containing protein [Oscillospiraceae bacterium]|nr:CHC2 zinc finger domain-containing protein [Ruminococcus sp.]MCD8345920.1 CHC2 zinc finger domain-containing protein [Oscillospiraceae bacterium]
MNIFEEAKATVSLKQAAEHYGLEPNHSGMVRCPFHEDKHPSMKLNEDYFYCFGCGASGDVIELTRRLFNLTSYEAARKLEEDFGIKPSDKPIVYHKSTWKQDMDILFRYLRVLKRWKEWYAPKSPEYITDRHFIEACQNLEYVAYLVDKLTFSDKDERTELMNELHESGYIERLKEEVNHE